MPARPPTAEPPDGHVVVGRVVGAWGIRGDVKVQPQTDFPERFSAGSQVFVNGAPDSVVSSRPHRAGLVVRLKGTRDRTKAESLRNALLTVRETDIAPLPEGAYYHFELIDMKVVSEDGEPLGAIAEILDTSANDVYVIRGESARDLLIPAIREFVLDVDVDAGLMTVRLMDGMR